MMRVDPNILHDLRKQIHSIKREQYENVLNTYLLGKQKDRAGLFLNEVIDKPPQPMIFSTKPVSNLVKQDDKENEINQNYKPRKPS